MAQLDKKIALVTGASRGIGAASAKALAAEGAHVILCARTIGGLERTHDEIAEQGGAATIMPLDLKKGDDIDMVGPNVFERFGGLDIFVGNAGTLGGLRMVSHHNPKVWKETFDVNVHANYRLIRTLDPLLKKSDAGRAVFITSRLAEMNEPFFGLYAATKAALNAFVKIYAAEMAETKVRANLLVPGVIHTSMMDESYPGGFPDKSKLVQPEDAAAEVLKLCLPECNDNGQILSPLLK